MYEAYWGLTEKPFRNTPDARFLFFTRQLEEALTRLLYTITEDKGAMVLTGECGCGKTFLSRILFEQLDPERYDIAMLPHPNLSPEELLREILHQFGYEAPGGSAKTELLHLLNDCLLANRARGRSTIVLVDEAQMIRDETTLEEIRLLLNFQQDRTFLLTLILMGQPEFGTVIDELPQLRQRLAVRFHLDRLKPDERRAYVRHRLRVAGATQEIFTSGAETLLVEASEGVPRRLNNLADMALMVGFGQKAPVVDEGILRHVAADIDG